MSCQNDVETKEGQMRHNDLALSVVTNNTATKAHLAKLDKLYRDKIERVNSWCPSPTESFQDLAMLLDPQDSSPGSANDGFDFPDHDSIEPNESVSQRHLSSDKLSTVKDPTQRSEVYRELHEAFPDIGSTYTVEPQRSSPPNLGSTYTVESRRRNEQPAVTVSEDMPETMTRLAQASIQLQDQEQLVDSADESGVDDDPVHPPLVLPTRREHSISTERWYFKNDGSRKLKRVDRAPSVEVEQTEEQDTAAPGIKSNNDTEAELSRQSTGPLEQPRGGLKSIKTKLSYHKRGKSGAKASIISNATALETEHELLITPPENPSHQRSNSQPFMDNPQKQDLTALRARMQGRVGKLRDRSTLNSEYSPDEDQVFSNTSPETIDSPAQDPEELSLKSKQQQLELEEMRLQLELMEVKKKQNAIRDVQQGRKSFLWWKKFRGSHS